MELIFCKIWVMDFRLFLLAMYKVLQAVVKTSVWRIFLLNAIKKVIVND